LCCSFLALKRLRASEHETNLNEAWGYTHRNVNVASDTHMICDWSGVDPEAEAPYQMPTCSKGTCPGHREVGHRSRPFSVCETTESDHIEIVKPSGGVFMLDYDIRFGRGWRSVTLARYHILKSSLRGGTTPPPSQH
jgi:hypothetical protein